MRPNPRSTRTPTGGAARLGGRRLPWYVRLPLTRLRRAWPLLLAVGFVVLGAIAAVRTVINSGPAALAQMNDRERVLLARLETIRRGMSPAQVKAILGEPDDPGPLGLRPKWQVGANPLNAVAVYFHPEGAHRILWLSVGQFSYDREL